MAQGTCMDFSGSRTNRSRLCPSPPRTFSLWNLEAILVDTTRNNLNDLTGDDSTPLIARNSMVWGIFLVGIVVGFLAVYVVVAQPMFAQLSQVQSQIASLETDMQALVGVRNSAWETGNLLSDLTALKNQLRDARSSIREIRALRQDLL